VTKEFKESARLVIDVIVIPLISAAIFVLWDLNKSISSLNVQVGILLTSNQGIEKRIDKLEERVFNGK
jgi:uncharacterized membrane protein YqjE